ncbi:cocosin 1-like [Malania oleifera]|uniref:cocosin 1-like n=1 Tax=Malania oleifera TaxID=397392 RepID=UPI0025ADCA46|nr:cocosin 1-like [Malania oleifera]
MAKTTYSTPLPFVPKPLLFLILFSLSTLTLFHRSCLAQLELQKPQLYGDHQPRRLHRGFRTECRIDRLRALKPTRSVQSEAGETEYYDQDNKQLQCVGVAVIRLTIHLRGLLVPSYTNAPQLIHILQGRGILGIVIPGCPETYEFSSWSQQKGKEGRQQYRDRYQKRRRVREGEVVALPVGVVYYLYNDGEEDLVVAKILDTSNDANQLDPRAKSFYLAGYPRKEGERGEEKMERERVFAGLGKELLGEAFDTRTRLTEKLQGKADADEYGIIVYIEEQELRLLAPETQREEEEDKDDNSNGLEENICTLRLQENLARPSRADLFNPRGGRVATSNSHTLPILKSLRLNAQNVVLYKNAIVGPHYQMNAHSVVYVRRGSGRVQVVGDSGKTVFDGEIEKGEVLVIPQNFVSLTKASDSGLEYVAVKTNDNAMETPLAGEFSVFRSLPVGVLSASYDISREDAQSLKENRREQTIFGPRSTRERDHNERRADV